MAVGLTDFVAVATGRVVGIGVTTGVRGVIVGNVDVGVTVVAAVMFATTNIEISNATTSTPVTASTRSAPRRESALGRSAIRVLPS